MYLKQICMGWRNEAAYFVISDGEAIIIDPVSDVEEHLHLAKQHKAKIKYIFETHFHADFLSGPLELSKQTGAPVVYGPKTETNFPFHLAGDGEIFKIGSITLEVIHTPGHTLESTCYLLKDESGRPHCIFTGDTLFTGNVGRPDPGSGNTTREQLASMMYDTIRDKIMPLPDDVIVYPANGPGTICDKIPSLETITTIGEQKKNNYALQPQTREAFIAAITNCPDETCSGLSINAKINKEGRDGFDEIKRKELTPLGVKDMKLKIKDDILVLDTRSTKEFSDGFIPGSMFIGLEGRFAEWAGNMLLIGQRMVLVTDPGKEEEVIARLTRAGFNNVEGYLIGGVESWKKAGEKMDMIIDVEADELAMDIPFDDNLVVVDVRNENEFAGGHIKDAVSLPLNHMTDIAQIVLLKENQNIYVHCDSGYRSMIAVSMLKRQGYHNLRNISDGWAKIKEQKNIKIEQEASILN